MSLKAFHILFITMAILLAVGCAAWSFCNEITPAFGIISLLAAVGLLFYGIAFLKKARKIII